MPIFKINVKWQKEKYSDIECNTEESPANLKAVLYSLTGVPPDRQKVMMPGGILGDTYEGIKLRNGANVMLMGTAEEIKVITDIKEVPQHIAAAIEKPSVPQGLCNLGNTCYMNAIVQLFFSCPEIGAALKLINKESSVQSGSDDNALTANLSHLFQILKKATGPITPMFFLATLQAAYPIFATTQGSADGAKSAGALDIAEKMGGSDFVLSMANLAAVGSSGATFMQQDANECWQVIMRALQKATIDTSVLTTASEADLPASFGKTGGWNPVNRFLTGRLETKLKCTETEEEPETSGVEEFTQLSCFINKDVKYLHTGIRNGLQGSLTKRSAVLDRDAEYKKDALVSRLPAYLTIQFVRFFYKEKEKINAKVLKDVKFPLSLDMYEFCTPDLQSKLVPMREVIQIEETKQASEGPKRVKKPNAPPEEEPELKEEELAPYWFEDDLGSNNTGFYELRAVVTHQGRSSNQGHYVAWVKQKNKWVKFDDDEVSFVHAEDILRLSGGGDWHCAYILLYAPKRIAKEWIANANSAGSASATSSTAIQKENGRSTTNGSGSAEKVSAQMSKDGGDK